MEREICGPCDAMLPTACTCPPDDELHCPLCDHIVYVSPEDADASLSEMVGHLRREHHGENVNGLLARVRLVKAGA